jgi:murein DD-endopeptidase MepM/ murein hydrolase activator NlpD
MQGSRAIARVTKSSPSTLLSSLTAWTLPWRDHRTISRYTGHLILGLLFLALIYGVSPLRLDAPPLELLMGQPAAPAVESARSVPAYAVAQSETNARYLEPGVVPFTMRTWGETLPMMEGPRRVVRTSVTQYTVQAGDTMLGIAQRFGLKGTTLLYANNSLADQPDLLKIGQVLNILPVDGVYHTVAKGETLANVAAKYKVEPEAIALYPGNNLAEPYELTADQKLIVPGGVKPYVPRTVTTYQSTGSATRAGATGTGQLAWPMSGRISQGYWEGHRAIDISAPRGTSILAADGGTVVAAHYSNVGYGRMVVVDHGNGYQTLYAHMDAFYVEVGQAVTKAQVIGKCGSTGNSTGPHLHFEVRKGGVQLNPYSFLP